MVKRTNRATSSEPMLRSINEVAEHWLGVINHKLPTNVLGSKQFHPPSEKVSQEIKDIVLALSCYILNKWRDAATNEADGSVDSANLAFQHIYVQNKMQAQGSIVAIIELLEAVGNRRELPEQFKGLLI